MLAISSSRLDSHTSLISMVLPSGVGKNPLAPVDWAGAIELDDWVDKYETWEED